MTRFLIFALMFSAPFAIIATIYIALVKQANRLSRPEPGPQEGETDQPPSEGAEEPGSHGPSRLATKVFDEEGSEAEPGEHPSRRIAVKKRAGQE